MAAGRPPKFKDEAELASAIESYLVAPKGQPNKAGLRVALGISRETYSQYKTKYPDAIKAAEDVIEDAWVQRLNGSAPAGAIFYLKNAFAADYKDRQEADITSGGAPITTLTDGDRAALSELRDLLKQRAA